MTTTSRIFLCLLWFTLPLASGYGSEGEATVQTNSAAQERKAGDRMVLTIKDVEYAFRWCPAGTFTMGSPASEPNRNSNETQHPVMLTRGFWMLETEVTQKMWEGVMGNNPSYFKDSKRFPVEKFPVERVSWNDCQEYIKKLNELLAGTPGAPAGFKFSLPTEAQWEYACRAGMTTPYHFGNTLNEEQANLKGGQTKDVGSYPANAWGLHDMHGNVWEWCLDRYGDYPNGAVTDPMGTERVSNRVSNRVLRGGYWSYYAKHCRSADRLNFVPSAWSVLIGLRVSLVSSER